MTRIKLNKKDIASITVSSIGGASVGFAAYVATMIPILTAEAGGTNKGFIRIAKFGALVGSALVCGIAVERLGEMTDYIMENGMFMGIEKAEINKNGVELEIDK